MGTILVDPSTPDRVGIRAKVVRDALTALEEEALSQGRYVEALAFERLANNEGDDLLDKLARMIRT